MTKPLVLSGMIVSSAVKITSLLVQRWILVFRDKSIRGSQGIRLSFRFLFYLVYYFARCNFLVKFVFVLPSTFFVVCILSSCQ